MSRLLGHLDVHGEGLYLKVLMLEQIVPDLEGSNFLGSVVSMLEVIIESPWRKMKVVLRGLVRL